jgi:hypothetical protein
LPLESTTIDGFDGQPSIHDQPLTVGHLSSMSGTLSPSPSGQPCSEAGPGWVGQRSRLSAVPSLSVSVCQTWT